MKRLLLSAPLLLSQSAFAESGIKYGYSTLKSNFEYYTGTRTSDATTKVHEFSISDSSGALGASLQTIGNQMSAEAGAINAERMKVEKGESIGGPKTLSYSYERDAAKDGDAKIYSLRLGSTENAFSGDTLDTDRTKDKMVTFAEIAMSASVKGGMLYSNDILAIRYEYIKISFLLRIPQQIIT